MKSHLSAGLRGRPNAWVVISFTIYEILFRHIPFADIIVTLHVYFQIRTRFLSNQAIDRAGTGFGKFWKAMESDNAIFQDLESVAKRCYGKVLDLCLGKF